jgi:hypothetical protein
LIVVGMMTIILQFFSTDGWTGGTPWGETPHTPQNLVSWRDWVVGKARVSS